MEIIGEIIVQVLGWLLELLLQGIFEIIGELLGHCIKEPFRRPKPIHPVLAAMGYAIFGAIAGAISLWIFPAHFISSHWLRIVNLLLTPCVAGILMALIGAWRMRHQQELIRLDRFSYGFCFALAMAVIRFTYGS